MLNRKSISSDTHNLNKVGEIVVFVPLNFFTIFREALLERPHLGCMFLWSTYTLIVPGRRKRKHIPKDSYLSLAIFHSQDLTELIIEPLSQTLKIERAR